MATPEFTEAELRSALTQVGVSVGSTLILHSSLLHLGRLQDVERADVARRIVDVFIDLIGPTGTLAVPASNWEYGAKGEPFDVQATPAARDLGVLSAHMLTRDGVRRSPNPTFSLALLGERAEWVCAGGNAHAFGYDSAWDRLFQVDATMVFLGCDLSALSFTRYIEMRFGVPYLYNKVFTTPVIDHGVPIKQPVVSLLRYRDLDVEYDLSRFEVVLTQRGGLRAAGLGAGRVRAVRMSDCFSLGMECLKSDIHFFLTKPPVYFPDRLPSV